MIDQNPENPHSSASETRQGFFFVGLILLFTFLAYSSILSATYIWDDDDYILNNATLRSLEGLWSMWFEFGSIPQYYPLVHTTFWLEFQLWGLHPLGYHVVNLILHASSACMLGVIIDGVYRKSERSHWLTAGRIAAILFALHPVCVESAAWITERKNVLSLFLGLCAAYHFLQWQRDEQKWRYGITIALFIGALLSKTVVCSLPAVLLVLIWVRNGRIKKQDWKSTAPMFALGIGLAFITVWMEKHHVGASGAEWDITILERIAVAGKSCWFYVGKILWPANLSFIYPRWEVSASGMHLVPAFAWIALGAALLTAQKKVGRAPVGIWSAYSGILFPALGFIDVYPFRYSFVADHFQYHAMTIPIAAIAILIHKLPAKRARTVLTILIIALTMQTWQYGRTYHNEETLWRATIDTNPKAWMAHNNLGIIQLSKKDLAGSEKSFRTTIDLYPRHGNAWANLGMTLDLQDRPNEANEAFDRAKELLPNRPDMWRIVAQFYSRRNRHEEALAAWREVILRAPDDAEAIRHAATTLTKLGRPEQAERLLRESPAMKEPYQGK